MAAGRRNPIVSTVIFCISQIVDVADVCFIKALYHLAKTKVHRHRIRDRRTPRSKTRGPLQTWWRFDTPSCRSCVYYYEMGTLDKERNFTHKYWQNARIHRHLSLCRGRSVLGMIQSKAGVSKSVEDDHDWEDPFPNHQ